MEKKDEQGNIHFQFLCAFCNRKKSSLLELDKGTFVRDGEPASCNDCALQCGLTAQELWGAEDQVRYRVCHHCVNYENCELKGRYYC